MIKISRLRGASGGGRAGSSSSRVRAASKSAMLSRPRWSLHRPMSSMRVDGVVGGAALLTEADVVDGEVGGEGLDTDGEFANSQN
eukprot:scaffold143301_cov28-Tisochrysis_lutea.AAC.1